MKMHTRVFNETERTVKCATVGERMVVVPGETGQGRGARRERALKRNI